MITVRRDPVRVAEEYATADVISRGRLDIGFVKSGDSEMVSGNANPVGIVERFWEAIDLITEALTSHEGPFSWEGKHFTHRHVNIWPPCYQRPHPPMWAATGDPDTSARTRSARHGQCAGAARDRRHQARLGRLSARRGRRPGCRRHALDRFAYTAFVYVGDTDEEGVRSRQQAAVVPQHQPEAGAADFRSSCRAGRRRKWRPASTAPGRGRARPARPADALSA